MMQYNIQCDNINNSQTQELVQPFNCFEDRVARKKFIQKTCGYMFFSMFCTFVTSIYFNFDDSAKYFITTKIGQLLSVLSISFIISFIYITLCFSSLMQQSPSKYIFYSILTYSISWNVGLSCMYMKSDILISAILITTGTLFALTLYSLITVMDFTRYYEYYFVSLFTIISMSIVNIFLNNSILNICLAGSGSLIFSLLIVYDIQLIVSQKHIRYRYNLDDSIFAAMNLYLDTINLFIYILDCLFFCSHD